MKEFKLTNKELIELDKEIFELNKFYSLAINSLNRFPNIYASKEFENYVEVIEKKLKSIKTENEFEKIFIENSLFNLESQKTYLNYFSKGDIKVDKMIKIVLGKDSLDLIKNNMKVFDYKEYWEYYLSYRDYSYKSIPVDDENLREKFKGMLVDLKKDFLDYCKKEHGLPEDYDFELVLGQPYSQETFFHPTNRRMEVSPSYFFVFKEGDEIKINVAGVMRVLFHEILGHGRHEVLSREMPLSMQNNSINTSLPSLHIHFEGVSQLSEKESFDFMRKFSKKYSVEEDYIKQMILGEASKGVSNFAAFYKYLGLKEIEDNSFKKDEEFKKITGNHGLSILYSSRIESSLGVVGDAVYPLGINYLENYLSDLKKRIGEEAFEKNHIEINKAVATGVFNFKVLPRFVDFYLKQKGVIESSK